MRSLVFALSILALLSPSPARAADPPKLELKDGDRIVYLGNTFVERDQSYGYLETLLTIRHPDISFTFRNLGWSGDTVWGDARARFGTRADGFAHLKEHVLALKPTVILVGYGMNESFAGQEGLAEFEKGLNALLDTLAETKAKIVLISPIPLENLGPPLPDPSKHNLDLKKYRDVLGQVATTRQLVFADLWGLRETVLPERFAHLTDDGIHLTADGYHRLSETALGALFQSDSRRFLELRGSDVANAKGWSITSASRNENTTRFDAVGANLCSPPSPPRHFAGGSHSSGPGGGQTLVLKGLPTGSYRMSVDGKNVADFKQPATAETLVISWTSGPEIDQVEKLRSVINAKNELYFHRWRPQNETYLFGFRKHEQGNNSVEIPQFDPLVAEKEAEIARLKKPVKYSYELIRVEKGK